jgi:dephospho-CoA kinase
MIIGITGGTGCGKTTALKTLQQLGAVILDCDAIYHSLLKEDASLLSAIERRFPDTVERGMLNRRALADIVFRDAKARQDLNCITHSAVKAQVKRHLAVKPKLAAIDAIALFESGLSQLCDVTVAITAPEQVRVQRLTRRDGITPEQAKQRIDAQRPQEEFSALCDYTLHNDGTQPEFEAKCLAFFKRLCIMELS